MKNKQKLLVTLAISTLLISSVTGCGKKRQETDAEGNVIVQMSLMNSVNENPGWLAMIDAANQVLKDNGDKVKIEPEIIPTISWDEYYTKISLNIRSKVGGTIGRIAESHVPIMVENRQLADLTTLVEELKASGEFNNGSFEGVAKKDGKYYGIPSGIQSMVLYYNKTLFDQYNTAHPDDQLAYPSSDWSHASTFEQIRDAARKLSSGSGSSRRFGLSAGPFLAYGGMYSKNSGGENIFDAEGNCCIDSQPFYDVYSWFESMLVGSDRCMPSTEDTQRIDAMARFQGGNVAMIVDGVWQLHDVCKYTEDYEIGVAAIPVLADGYSSYTTTFGDRFWAARTSTHPEADQKALKALMSAEAINALASKQVGGLPVRTASISTFTNGLLETKLKNYVNTISEATNNILYVPYSTYYNQVDQQINQKMAVWINGQMSTVDFVKFMDTTMKEGMAGRL